MKFRFKPSALGVAVLLVAAVMAVYAGVGRVRQHDREETFYASGDYRDRVWPKLPVSVTMSADVEAAYKEQVERAAHDINGETGCTLLTTKGEGKGIRVLTILDDPCPGQAAEDPGKRAGEATYVCRDGTTAVLVANVAHIAEIYVAVKHGFGHAFGLTHDAEGDDLMRPTLLQADWANSARPLPWLSTKDREAIANRYQCPH